MNYDHGAGFGLTCVWFDYNSSQKRCRCYGAGTFWGNVASQSGTHAYLMNRKCYSSHHGGSCNICWDHIYVKKTGQGCCFLGLCSDNWYCRSCPVLQNNDGRWLTPVIEEERVCVVYLANSNLKLCCLISDRASRGARQQWMLTGV